MCGRYTLTTPLDELVSVFDVPEVGFRYEPRYNVAPTQTAPVVARDDEGRRMGLMRWGLVPFWADNPVIGNKLINARSETASEKPAFRSAFRRRRCLVPADGFYEWRREGEGKVPYWIHRPDRRPFALAGLWERWEPEDAEPLFTYTILTREATPGLKEIHSRMPVLLPEDRRREWLDRDAGPEALDALLDEASGPELEYHPVSTLVNSPSNDAPGCIEPVDPDGSGGDS